MTNKTYVAIEHFRSHHVLRTEFNQDSLWRNYIVSYMSVSLTLFNMSTKHANSFTLEMKSDANPFTVAMKI